MLKHFGPSELLVQSSWGLGFMKNMCRRPNHLHDHLFFYIVLLIKGFPIFATDKHNHRSFLPEVKNLILIKFLDNFLGSILCFS